MVGIRAGEQFHPLVLATGERAALGTPPLLKKNIALEVQGCTTLNVNKAGQAAVGCSMLPRTSLSGRTFAVARAPAVTTKLQAKAPIRAGMI